MATLEQLERALINADKAGDADAARQLAAVINRARREQPSAAIPDTQVQETIQMKPEPSAIDQAIGAGETALTIATGATGGTLGTIGGTLKGLAEQILSGKYGDVQANQLVQQQAMKGAQAMTWAPRTQVGQEQVSAIGDVLSNVPPVIPIIGPIGGVAQGVK